MAFALNFNFSNQSIFCNQYIFLQENLLPRLSNLWHDYPHTEMTFLVKFYFLLQIAYWVHCVPELYFLKAKKVCVVFILCANTLCFLDKLSYFAEDRTGASQP